MKWKCNLNILKNIKLSRCYKPEGFGQVVSNSLHHFSDASESGYGQVVYVRLVNAVGKIHCSLVIAKSHVAPIKGYFRYKTITSQNVLSEAHSKNFFIS